MLSNILQRPLAIFDIESTGLNKKTDRIIDLAILRLYPDGQTDTNVYRVNPECPIPPESTKVHGITDDDVKDAPSFKDIAHKIATVLTDCDFAGFNIVRYDAPLLLEEFARAGVPFNMEGRRILDAQRIYHIKEPRDLSAALQFYCGKEHTGAHGAMSDVDATLHVLEAQLQRYEDLPDNIDELDALCNPRNPSWADQAGKIRWHDGELVINFGQKTGVPLKQLALTERGYLEWILKKDFDADTKNLVREALDNSYKTTSKQNK